MDQGVRLVRFDGDESRTIAQAPSAQVELKHVRNVTRSVAEDALNVWADLWAELENDVGSQTHNSAFGGPVACGVAAAADAEKGFKPSCGWPEFLEKMWVLRQNLDFLARFSRQPDDVPRPCGSDSQLPS
jgi:hypothetical protein